METTLVIKNILLPKLEKDANFSKERVHSVFWEKFTTDLLRFEEDAKPIYGSIYSLELANAEKIIDKLPNIYSQFLKQLAESYVLDQTSDATDYFLKTNNKTFAKEIDFLQTMKQVIKSVERKRIKADLPTSYERLTFELSDANLANVARKKGREDLKEKFKNWDADLEEKGENVPVITMIAPEEEVIAPAASKVISLSRIKYAAAASIIIAAGIFYFKNMDTDLIPIENTVVTKEKVKDKIQPQINLPTIEAIVLAPIETTSRTITVLQPESLGFTGDKKANITINFKDATKRMLSLEKLLEQNKTSQTIDSKILGQHKSELSNLKIQKDTYVFDGKTLTLFSKKATIDYTVLQTEVQVYYLKKGDEYYTLKVSNIPLPLEKVSDAATIETLEKIHFENQQS
nr:hypothetical protein [uncultured Flavobacterium sp.]